ncbi:DinB family protein [Flagellimonas sp. 2504JD1-5]
MRNAELSKNEFDAYYGRYIYKVEPEVDLKERFQNGHKEVINFFKSLTREQLNYRYAMDKWNCKEILQHLIDTERIFMYRCFRIARNDKTDLAGFDQNIYIEPSAASQKSVEALLEEYTTVRNASISLLKSLSDKDLANTGNANAGTMSARAAAFTIIGHEIWHMDIIKERYL